MTYGHAPARRVLRRRRAAQLLAGRRAARRHAAGRQPADPRAREAARGRSSSTARAGASSRPRPGCGSTAAPSACSRSRSRSSPRSPTRAATSSPGASRSAPRPGRAGSCSRSFSASSRRSNPELHVALWVFDTQTIVERVAARELELGVVGAARRHRGVVFEPFFRDEVILACPPGHRFAGKTVTLDELRGSGLIVMQEGAGVRQVIEDELRRAGTRLRDLDVQIELGLQESVTSAVRAGLRRHVHLALVGRVRPRRRHARGGARRRARARREIFLVRASGRAETRAAARVRRVRARAPPVIVRWSLAELPGVLAELGVERPFLVASPRWAHVARGAGGRPLDGGAVRPDRGPPEADVLLALGGGSAIDTAKGASAATGLPLVSVPTTYSGAEWTTFFGVRTPDRRMVGGGGGREPRRDRLRRRPDARPAAGRDRRHGAERARPLRRGALRQTHRAQRRVRARRGRADRPLAAYGRRGTPDDRRGARGAPRGARRAAARRSRSPGSRSRTRWRRRSAAATACRTAR